MEKNQDDISELEDLVDLAQESLKLAGTHSEEVVEAYAHKLRMNFQRDPQLFRKCFMEGYRNLLSLLQRNSLNP